MHELLVVNISILATYTSNPFISFDKTQINYIDYLKIIMHGKESVGRLKFHELPQRTSEKMNLGDGNRSFTSLQDSCKERGRTQLNLHQIRHVIGLNHIRE